MNTTAFNSEKSWPNALILWSIHGNELSGSLAIEKFIENVWNKTMKILSGSITLISHCNPEAIKQKTRFIEDNLNRCFYEWQNKSSYEGELARQIMPAFEGKTHLLDLHSTSGPSIPFLFSERRNFEIAEKLGVPYVVVGWNDLGASSIAWDTENYMNKRGGWGFTFEAGNHDSPDGAKNAYQVLLNFLTNLWIIDISHFQLLPWEKTFIEMISVYTCKTGEFEFKLDEFENFSPLKAGTLIGLDGNEEIRAESDCTLVMPSLRKIKKGEDAFFLAKLIK